MIKFLATKEGRPMIGLGLSRGNCRKLLEGKPIFIDLKVMMMDVGELPNLNDATILIFGGENETEMQAQLEEGFGGIPNANVHVDHRKEHL